MPMGHPPPVCRRGAAARIDEVADLIAIEVDSEGNMVCLGHELLAEVGVDEAASANHANGERRGGVAVKIQVDGRRRGRGRWGGANRQAGEPNNMNMMIFFFESNIHLTIYYTI